jgi:hypothetical protein
MLHEFASRAFQPFERLAVGQAILEMLGEIVAHHHSVDQSKSLPTDLPQVSF